ncbi:hypothetical protein [Neobacillus mesonae]|uniref:Uncharacterized protein n=1 Tax=Neobacillus mesonae TaxID=1193713 RepID=A0A3Q9QQX4_9BACI|nr:hypothetical protein [Neobacillus mesonae]AZU61085.1 hypothetical protein CHR53_07360 [Neobacillus mesonae]
MKQVFKYDSNGNYVEPVLIEADAPLPKNCTDKPLPQPCWKPVFKNGAWVETATESERNPSPPPIELSPTEILQAENDDLKRQMAQLNADFSAFMDYIFSGGVA